MYTPYHSVFFVRIYLKKLQYYKNSTEAFIKRAENGTQTRDPQLGRLMLYQLSYFRIKKGSGHPSEFTPIKHKRFIRFQYFHVKWWAKMDSNHRRYKPADLQSAPFGRSGICPNYF